MTSLQEQYLEISTNISRNSTVFGLGEHASSKGLPLTREGVPITMWNRDRPSRYPDENLYGSHPHLLELRKGEPAHFDCHVHSYYQFLSQAVALA